MFIVKVKFEGTPNRRYSYICPYTNVMVGEKVIVESPSNGYTAVEVMEIVPLNHPNAGVPTKYVVTTIDDREYKADKAARERLLEIEAVVASATAARNRATETMEAAAAARTRATAAMEAAKKAEEHALAAVAALHNTGGVSHKAMADLFDRQFQQTIQEAPWSRR